MSCKHVLNIYDTKANLKNNCTCQPLNFKILWNITDIRCCDYSESMLNSFTFDRFQYINLCKFENKMHREITLMTTPFIDIYPLVNNTAMFYNIIQILLFDVQGYSLKTQFWLKQLLEFVNNILIHFIEICDSIVI